ncbi:hypothetical protein [Sandaracinus amylolyticus]|uniref:Lipoprotein n=1 Tax=Sandaracinus amylolyticus TaxID=927083 RepID=A0A0F6YJZ4_9BACT|nr:hypothetical protein [Sandaracinus amylolyticus]AKF08272.1 hypothetical protein DB32_005421 [Sandaracinus amylolyticus]
MGLRRRKIGTALVIAAIGIVGMGCFERSLQPVNPCTRSRAGDNIRVESVDEVDLLFMIDNSNSMAEEQTSLTEELPTLVRVLASGDRDGDGMQDFEPVRSLHIGVVTSDMGVGGFEVPTCDGGLFGANAGDDGVLITRGRTSIPGCEATYPNVFDFQRDRDDPMTFAADVACVATTGTGGCGFEQQLEAVLKALSPASAQPWTVADYVPPFFHNSTLGHSGPGGANDGFIRPNSALAVILVTDEEDCSTPNPALFDPGSPDFSSVDLNLRCFSFPAQVHPVERYVRGIDGRSGLLGLRQNPNLLIFAGIVGVPVESVSDPSAINYEEILAHPDMMEMIDPSMPTRLRPSCNVPGRGVAFPPRRIVRAAQAIEQAGGSATIQSICQESYAGALDAIIAKIADALGGACLPRDLNPDAEGFVQCDVFEILPATGDTTSCEGLPGRDPDFAETVDVNGVPRQMCKVIQISPAAAGGGGQGWFYETAEAAVPGSDIGELCGADGQRISFAGISPTTNSDIRLECLQTVRPGAGTPGSIGDFCDPAAADQCPGLDPANRSGILACDAADRTCRVPCENDSQCTAAGLLGDTCDDRPWLDAVGANDPDISEEERARRMMAIPAGTDPNSPHNFCVNPTCI